MCAHGYQLDEVWVRSAETSSKCSVRGTDSTRSPAPTAPVAPRWLLLCVCVLALLASPLGVAALCSLMNMALQERAVAAWCPGAQPFAGRRAGAGASLPV